MRNLMSLLVLLVLALNIANADTLPAEPDVRKFADSVMAKVGSGDLTGAFAAMKPYTIVPPSEFDVMALTSKSQRELVGGRYGAPAGYEFIGETKAGASLLKLTYIEKTEHHALPWMFFFYRSPNGWVLNTFLWHDQVQNLLGGR